MASYITNFESANEQQCHTHETRKKHCAFFPAASKQRQIRPPQSAVFPRSKRSRGNGSLPGNPDGWEEFGVALAGQQSEGRKRTTCDPT